MTWIPISYNLRSLWVRRTATALTALGLGATVAVVAGVLSLQQGLEKFFTDTGRDDVWVFLRPGASQETESFFQRERADILMKELPEIAEDANGRPLASGEISLAVRLKKFDGGETNVPIRGVQPATFEIYGDDIAVTEGRRFELGNDEIIVGRRLVDRIQNAQVGNVLLLNVTPFRVVGVLDHDGPYSSEIWGDVDRMGEALERPGFNRIIARPRAGSDVEVVAERLADDRQVPAKLLTERVFRSGQTVMLSTTLKILGGFLGVVMGVAAIFTAANTMLTALAGRTREIGILLSIGYRPFPIFLSFLGEAVVLGLAGGVLGCLMALPLNGVETGTTNWDTFTEVAFAFRITPQVLVTAVGYALLLGLLGGAIPAWRAARLEPTEALRRR